MIVVLEVRSSIEYLWDGSTKYQLAALHSIEKPGKRLIGYPALIDAKLQTLE